MNNYSVEIIQGVVEAGQAANIDVVLNAHPRHESGRRTAPAAGSAS